MPRLLADANFHRAIVRGLLRRRPDIDIVRAQELGFERTTDPDLLDWATRERRVILTHDIRTIPGFAFARTRAGQSFPGVIEVGRRAAIGPAIEDILILLECLDDDEWENRIWYVPL